jgi:hypothetical protein
VAARARLCSTHRRHARGVRAVPKQRPRASPSRHVTGSATQSRSHSLTQSALATLARYRGSDAIALCSEGVDLITFEKGQRKDDVTQRYLRKFKKNEGVLYVDSRLNTSRIVRRVQWVLPALPREVWHENPSRHGKSKDRSILIAYRSR